MVTYFRDQVKKVKEGGRQRKRKTKERGTSRVCGSSYAATADAGGSLEAPDPPACHPRHRGGHSVAGHARVAKKCPVVPCL